MAVHLAQVCEDSADAYSVQALSVALTIVFGLYILFDATLGAFTVGAKAYELINANRTKEVTEEQKRFVPRAFPS